MSLMRCPVNTSVTVLTEFVRRDGGVIIEGLLTPRETETLHDQLQVHVERRSPGFREDAGDDEFVELDAEGNPIAKEADNRRPRNDKPRNDRRPPAKKGAPRRGNGTGRATAEADGE